MNYTSYEMLPIKSGKLKKEMEITVQNVCSEKATLNRNAEIPLSNQNQIKSLFESGKSPYTQTHTRIHKTQYTIKEENMKL